jgi:emp24/gp25L/p24 family/GOLD
VYVAYTEEEADPLEREVRTLAELLQQVKDEQEYIKVRERVHRNSTTPNPSFHPHFPGLGTDLGF